MNCYHIGMDDVIANAFIESIKQNGNRFLTYKQIDDYGNKVADLIRKDSDVFVDKSNTDIVLTDYADFFSEQTIDGALGIELKREKSISDLINQFRGYLPLDVLRAFVLVTVCVD
jgi:hypothetical protein